MPEPTRLLIEVDATQVHQATEALNALAHSAREAKAALDELRGFKLAQGAQVEYGTGIQVSGYDLSEQMHDAVNMAVEKHLHPGGLLNQGKAPNPSRSGSLP